MLILPKPAFCAGNPNFQQGVYLFSANKSNSMLEYMINPIYHMIFVQ
jgi:hypothetical protein